MLRFIQRFFYCTHTKKIKEKYRFVFGLYIYMYLCICNNTVFSSKQHRRIQVFTVVQSYTQHRQLQPQYRSIVHAQHCWNVISLCIRTHITKECRCSVHTQSTEEGRPSLHTLHSEIYFPQYPHCSYTHNTESLPGLASTHCTAEYISA